MSTGSQRKMKKMKHPMCETCYWCRITDNGLRFQCRNPYLTEGESVKNVRRFFSKENRPDRYDCEFYDNVETKEEQVYSEIKNAKVVRWF